MHSFVLQFFSVSFDVKVFEVWIVWTLNWVVRYLWIHHWPPEETDQHEQIFSHTNICKWLLHQLIFIKFCRLGTSSLTLVVQLNWVTLACQLVCLTRVTDSDQETLLWELHVGLYFCFCNLFWLDKICQHIYFISCYILRFLVSIVYKDTFSHLCC